MGILDDAIRDHLDLKRRSGAAQSDLKRLEDEAFGPPSRPGDPPSDSSPALTVEADPDASPPAGMDQAPGPRGGTESAVLEEPPPLEDPTILDQQAAPPSGDAPPDEITIEPGPDVDPAAEGPVDISDMPAFHDFAAEEGLVSAADAPAPAPPAEPPQAPPPEPPAPPVEPPPAPPQQGGEPEQPEPPLDDTQPHDMASELHTPEGHAVPPAEEIDVDADLDLDLDEEEELTPESVLPDAPARPPPPRPEPPADRVEVAEEEDDEDSDEDEELLDDDDVEVVEEDGDEPEDDAEDVLEETPDFLRETPEHDRLWFEQRAPKDFDFEEE